MSGAPAILARNIVKIYRTPAARHQALSGVDLTVAPGEFAVVAGPPGSGKTTLLSLLAGLEPADSGRIMILGRDIRPMSRAQLARFRLAHIGFMGRGFGLLEELTIRENAALPLLFRGMGRAEAMARAGRLLAELGLRDHLHHRPHELSPLQRQRAAMARAFIAGPGVVLADEPAASLDSAGARDILALLRALARERAAAVLIATRDRHLARAADRVIGLTDGRITTPEDERP